MCAYIVCEILKWCKNILVCTWWRRFCAGISHLKWPFAYRPIKWDFNWEKNVPFMEYKLQMHSYFKFISHISGCLGIQFVLWKIPQRVYTLWLSETWIICIIELRGDDLSAYTLCPPLNERKIKFYYRNTVSWSDCQFGDDFLG